MQSIKQAARVDDAATGIVGLDDILGGGLKRERLYLVEGSPGAGKTTAALSFLRAGAAAGERTLYVTLSETEAELRDTATAHGWTLDGIEIFELIPPENLLDDQQRQSLLYSSDLELGETTRMILDAVERAEPTRVVIDSLSEIRLLAQNSLRYRRQVLALKHYFARHNATVVLLDDLTAEVSDKTVHSVAHGVIRLEELAPEYGAERRRVRVVKYRGRKYRGGHHDFTIKTGGLDVYPPLGLVRAPDAVRPRSASDPRRRHGPVAGRGDRTGHQLPDPRPRGHGQVAADASIRHGGDPARRAGRPVRVRRGTRPAVRADQGLRPGP